LVEIAPFRGLIYNREEIEKSGGLLVAPPYDVLSQAEQTVCLDQHPHNILHLDYGRRYPDDEHKFSWHQRSGQLLQQWLADGVLTRLDKPAIFHVETTCQNPQKEGEYIARHGFICLMRLEEFSLNSSVRPHEKTFSTHKEERLSLMKNTGANISQVFGFFPDENRRAIEQMAAVTRNQKPDMDFTDYRSYGHRLWVSQDEAVNSSLAETLKDRRVYIADGHHRYETALNYRKWRIDQGQAPESANWVLIYLCPMSDPGLVIFPTHRLLNSDEQSQDEMINRLSRYFKISGKTFTEENEEIMRSRFLSKLKKQKNSLGLYLVGRNVYYVLRLLESTLENQALLKEPKELAALDTVILSNIVFMEALGLTEKNLDDPDIVSYISDLNQAIEMINKKEKSAAFILNPTSVEDILRVTEKGLTMPRKSTFFYPKVTTGLVLNLID
jgi:uncharacterized protein (DUF1015 family)